MNKKALLSLLLIPLLASCSNSVSVKTPIEIDKYVSKFESHSDVNSCNIDAKGYFFGIKTEYKGAYVGRLETFGSLIEDYAKDETTGDILYEDDERTKPLLNPMTNLERGYGMSYYLYAPIFLDYSNLVYNNKYGHLDELCQLSTIKNLVVDKGGSNAVFQTEFTKNGGIRFFANSTNILLDLFHIDEFNSGVSAACRWNISLTYDKKGCLTEEIIETIDQEPQEDSASLKTTYVYA